MNYLGERRVFKALEIKGPTDGSEEVEKKLSNLSLNGSSVLEEEEEVRNEGCASPVVMYKVGARTRLTVTAEGTGGDVTGGSQRNMSGRDPTFANVGGLKKQVQLLRELVLYPLKLGNKNGERCGVLSQEFCLFCPSIVK